MQPIAFTTEPIPCPGCKRGFDRGTTETDDVYELPDVKGGPACGVAKDLDDLAAVLGAVKTCHPVRGLAIGVGLGNDGAFEVGKDGFRWTYRGDQA